MEDSMESQILIKSGNNWFEFSKSRKGQLDYEGKLENEALPNVECYQKIASSTYFSPSWYTYLQDGLNNNPKVYVAQGIDIYDKDTFSFLVHIGAVLSAIEAKKKLNYKAEKIRKAKHDFYASLETSVQAEPYNQADKNSILVCIENIESKISWNPGLEKAGHIRALSAKVIREAKEEKMSYNGKLCRISYRETFVQMTV